MLTSISLQENYQADKHLPEFPRPFNREDNVGTRG